MAIGILKSSDNNWYQLTVVLDGVDYVVDIDQSPVSIPSPAWPEYWVIKNSGNGLNYKVYLDTTGGVTTLNVDQTNVSEPGNPYEILYCSDDSSYHKITVIEDSGSFVLGVNGDKTNFGTIGGRARLSINSKSSIAGVSRLSSNLKSFISGRASISGGGASTNISYLSGSGRLIHTQDSILQASDSNWYRFRLVVDGSDHVIDVDQNTSPNVGTVPYWVLTNPTNSLNYKVYLDIDGGGVVTLRVDQTNVSEPGQPYQLVYCITDQNYNKLSVITEGSDIILQINGDSTGRSSISGVASISASSTNVKSSQTGLARISANSKSSLSGLARINVNTKANILGLSRIQATLRGSVPGLSRISATEQSNIAGLARIGYSTITSSVSGTSRVTNSYNSSISGTSSISIVVNTNVNSLTGLSRIVTANKSTLAGLARIQQTLSTSQSGISKIAAYVGQTTITGKAKIAVRNRFKKSFIIRNEFNNNSPTIIQ